MRKITDLAVELCEEVTHSEDGLTFDIQEFDGGKKYLTHVKTARAAKQIGKPIGIYCNIESPKEGYFSNELTQALSTTLAKFVESSGVPFKKLLVIGLGNSRFVADSLGPKVCENIITNEQVATFAPSILSATGISSTEAARSITSLVKPSHVIVIDSLCCHEKSRLGTSFQIADTGITPGSGVYRNNQKIDKDFLGVPVFAVGVPLVIYLPSLHYVVPKTIDMLVVQCANVISDAISTIVN
ncbi:MAG: GPR endopeptidase [Firmicutes bacterium]|nr:GPR endopeptidase [Bacillota bacterium]